MSIEGLKWRVGVEVLEAYDGRGTAQLDQGVVIAAEVLLEAMPDHYARSASDIGTAAVQAPAVVGP